MALAPAQAACTEPQSRSPAATPSRFPPRRPRTPPRDGRDDPHRARDASRCRLRAHVIRRDCRATLGAPAARRGVHRAPSSVSVRTSHFLARSTRPRRLPPRRASRGPSPTPAPRNVALSPSARSTVRALSRFRATRPGLERPFCPSRRILSDHSHSSPTIIPDVPALNCAPPPRPARPRRHPPRLKPPGRPPPRRSPDGSPQARSAGVQPRFDPPR